jgi:hypothetical protein
MLSEIKNPARAVTRDREKTATKMHLVLVSNNPNPRQRNNPIPRQKFDSRTLAPPMRRIRMSAELRRFLSRMEIADDGR